MKRSCFRRVLVFHLALSTCFRRAFAHAVLDQQQPLVFLHIPKTGGSSVKFAFQKFWSEHCAQFIFNESTKINSDAPGIDCHWADLETSPSANDRTQLVLAALNGVRFRFLSGHFPFGYCIFAEKGCKYTTVIREPVSRLISWYFYAQRHFPEHFLKVCSSCDNLDLFVDAVVANTVDDYNCKDNLQTRMIAGDAFWRHLAKPKAKICQASSAGTNICDVRPRVNKAMYLRAKYHLKSSFAVVGVTDDLPGYWARLRALHLTNGTLPRLNFNPTPVAVPQRVVNKLAKLYFYDRKLYLLARAISKIHAVTDWRN